MPDVGLADDDPSFLFRNRFSADLALEDVAGERHALDPLTCLVVRPLGGEVKLRGHGKDVVGVLDRAIEANPSAVLAAQVTVLFAVEAPAALALAYRRLAADVADYPPSPPVTNPAGR